jgi:hypothetical protein
MMTTIGPHRLFCGDLTEGAISSLMGDELADVVYSDPPWGPSNLQYWVTRHSHGAVPRERWPGFLAAFCAAVARHSKPEAPIFVEMGLRWIDEVDAAMRVEGFDRRRRWSVTFGPKMKPVPHALTLYGTTDVNVKLPDPPHGEPVTRAALAAVVRPGVLVLDPCTGLGMTARSTHALGGAFRGNELNPTRLDRTATWLHNAARHRR